MPFFQSRRSPFHRTASLAVLLATAATPLAAHDRVFLHEQPIEIYWNSWDGLQLSADAGQVDVHIRGEGKTVSFDGILSLHCDPGGGSYWIVAGNAGVALSTNDDIAYHVPGEVPARAREALCRLGAGVVNLG